VPNTVRAGIAKDFENSFFLDEPKLRKLASILETYGAKLNPPASLLYSVSRRDDSFYETSDVDVVLADDNTPGKQIQTLSVMLLPPDVDDTPYALMGRRTVAKVQLGEEAELKGLFGPRGEVTFSVSDRDRDWCFLLADELETQIGRIVTGTSARVPLRALDLVIPLLLSAAVFLWAFQPLFRGPTLLTPDQIATMTLDQRTAKILEMVNRQSSFTGWRFVALFAALIGSTVVLELRVFSRVWRRLRGSVFYCGDMVPLRDKSEKRWYNFKWGVLIAFVVSLFASFAYTWLQRP
jgi:hypothetical protein